MFQQHFFTGIDFFAVSTTILYSIGIHIVGVVAFLRKNCTLRNFLKKKLDGKKYGKSRHDSTIMFLRSRCSIYRYNFFQTEKHWAKMEKTRIWWEKYGTIIIMYIMLSKKKGLILPRLSTTSCLWRCMCIVYCRMDHLWTWSGHETIFVTCRLIEL